MSSYPHVFLTSDSPWDPRVVDTEYPSDTLPIPELALERQEFNDNRVNDVGELQFNATRTISAATTVIALAAFFTHRSSQFGENLYRQLVACKQLVTPSLPNLESLRPNFGFVPVERIKKTLDATTQFYRATVHHPFRKHFKSRFPAANVRRIPEWVSTDTIFSDVAAADDGVLGHGGCMMLQLYGGMDSHFLAGYPLSSEAHVPATFEDFIRDHGAPQGLASDMAKSETSHKIRDILRMYCVKDRQSEPYYQHQNPIERRIQDVKRMSTAVMDHTGCPGKYWLLSTLYVIALLNVLVNANGVIPHSVVTGQVTDVSPFITFHFWESVFFEEPGKPERLGRWVGPAEKQGDILTYKIIATDTGKLVIRSNVRKSNDPLFPNRREILRNAENFQKLGEKKASLKNIFDFNGPTELPKFSPEELIGVTFLRETQDGEKVRAKIVRKVIDRDAEDHKNIKMLVSLGADEIEELIA